MVDKTDDIKNADLISQFTCAGIASAALSSAADVAKRLCMESNAAEADATNPYHANDYQHLFAELSRKTAK